MLRLLVTLALIGALTACASPMPSATARPTPTSAPSPTSTPTPTTTPSATLIPTSTAALRTLSPTPQVIFDCIVGANIYTWQDRDRDGLPGPDEPPLADVAISMFGWGSAARTTDDKGKASYFVMVRCPPPDVVATAESPTGYEPTTSLRVPLSRLAIAEPVRFGFAKRAP